MGSDEPAPGDKRDACGQLPGRTAQGLIPDATFELLWTLAVRHFALGSDSDHGPDHWQRVERNGRMIIEGAGAGDLTVVRLFAVLHDSKRENEFHDPEHGRRAADWAMKLRGDVFRLDEERFGQLLEALVLHDKGRVSSDPTIGACWDADRLDLGRVGIQPHPRFMSTQFTRSMLSRDG